MASSRRPGTNEDVKTFGAAGYGRDYTALQTWEDATDIDCVTGTTSPVVECHKDAASYALDGSWWEVAGATSNAAYFRVIRAASNARHLGVPGAGVRFTLGSATFSALTLVESYCALEDVELVAVQNTADWIGMLRPFGSHTRIIGVITTATNEGSGYASCICDCHATAVIVNSVAHNYDDAGFKLSACVIYACSAFGGLYGIYGLGQSFLAKNCLAYNTATNDWAASSASGSCTHNLSQDTSAPASNTYYHSKTLAFVDAANGDCRLVASDTDAINQGTDLSADATFPFDDDIAYTTRPAGAWDLGAFEYVAAASTVKPFFSRW